MHRSFSRIAVSLGLVATAALANAAQDTPGNFWSKSSYGSPAQATSNAKVVDVNSANALYVSCGDIVTFRNGDKNFSWKFDVMSHRSVDLQSVMPQGFSNKSLRIYVTPNEAEKG